MANVANFGTGPDAQAKLALQEWLDQRAVLRLGPRKTWEDTTREEFELWSEETDRDPGGYEREFNRFLE